MTTTPVGQRADLSERVAEEIRALLGRKRMSGAALARKLDVSPMWVSYRLNGRQPIDLDDLQRIAGALGVAVADLLPSSARLREPDRTDSVTDHSPSRPPTRRDATRPRGRAKNVQNAPSPARTGRRAALVRSA